MQGTGQNYGMAQEVAAIRADRVFTARERMRVRDRNVARAAAMAVFGWDASGFGWQDATTLSFTAAGQTGWTVEPRFGFYAAVAALRAQRAARAEVTEE